MWILSLLKPDRQAPAQHGERRRKPPAPATFYAPDSLSASPLDLAQFAKANPVTRVLNGRSLFRQGDPGRSMYLLTAGRAEVRAHGQLLEVLLPGAVIGESALLAPGPRPVTVTASQNCEFIDIDERTFYTTIQQTPEFAGFVMRALTRRLQPLS